MEGLFFYILVSVCVSSTTYLEGTSFFLWPLILRPIEAPSGKTFQFLFCVNLEIMNNIHADNDNNIHIHDIAQRAAFYIFITTIVLFHGLLIVHKLMGLSNIVPKMGFVQHVQVGLCRKMSLCNPLSLRRICRRLIKIMIAPNVKTALSSLQLNIISILENNWDHFNVMEYIVILGCTATDYALNW